MDMVNERSGATATAEDTQDGYPCVTGILGCLVLSIVYVGSLYVWRSPLNRDHPSVIKRRFFSVFVMTLLSPLSLYFGINEKFYHGATLCQLLGLRWPGIIQAIIIPLCLTMILFLGPLYMQGLSGLWRLYAEPSYWLGSAKTLVWWRNQVVAPLSEEWTFRACMLPLLLQCFAPITAIFICPLFFGAAHFHHIVENTRRGMDFKTALLRSCVQFAYSTVFGVYAAFLFAKTGHFIAAFTAHSFCNYMGFPDLSEVMTYEDHLERAKLVSLFVIGLVAWYFLLTPMTNPSWFSNNLFWQKHVLA
ncbi:CAAX prenyl protease 2 [Copidosoma floridanum]|uniref:CAAX prenyl protease 2 n=1 Tax=Copidosoma floridanum TaxID=29053 RepID=UPI0006C98DE9|nr:CAAX prenyl protease 2 [Copidosoma floridanum]XP_014218643.1 CAAX prenyl protease 2 [Copidosoma floridanum]